MTHGSKCWELEMKLQKKDIWKLEEKRKDRGVYIYHSKKEVTESFVGRCKWKQAVLEGRE